MEAFSNALASGQLIAFSEHLNGQHSSSEATKDTEQSYITTLYCKSSVKCIPIRHISYSQLQTAREYACVFDTLEKQLHVSQTALSDILSHPIHTSISSPSFHIEFEQMNRLERVTFILQLLHSFHTNSTFFWSQDMFSTSVYLTEITTILLLLRRNTILQKQPSYQLEEIVSFCCTLPIGSEIIMQLILNDPAVLERASTAIMEMIRHPCMTQGTISESLFYRALRTICIRVARLPGPFFAKRILTQLDRHLDSQAIGCHTASIMMQIHCEIQALQLELAVFLVKAFRKDLNVKNGVYALIELATQYSKNGDETCPELLDDVKMVLERVQMVLLDQCTTLAKTGNSFYRLKVMQAWIYLHTCFCPDPNTIKRLLQSLDDLTKAPSSVSERVISVAYALLLIICSSFAVEMAAYATQQQVPLEKTNITAIQIRELIATAQHDIFSLYNTRAACPALILGPILLYTKSPLAVSFLCNLIGEERFLTKALRPERLFLVGDHILKPILSEQTMVRETLTFSVEKCNVMTWNVLHRLLCERSFLRHHHPRRLEQWLVMQLQCLSLPLHPIFYSVLVEYIENYIVAFEYPISNAPLQLAILPLSNAFVMKSLGHAILANEYDPTCSVWAQGIAVLIYVLHFNQRLGQALVASTSKVTGELANAHIGGDICVAYALESNVPLRNMWRQVRLYHKDISPLLNRLILEEIAHLPEPNESIQTFDARHCALEISHILSYLKSIGNASRWSISNIEFVWRKCFPFAMCQRKSRTLDAVHFHLLRLYQTRVCELHPAFHFGQIVAANVLSDPQRMCCEFDATLDTKQYRKWICAPFRIFRDLHPLILESFARMELVCCLAVDIWRLASQKAQRLVFGTQHGVAHSTDEYLLLQDTLFFHAIVQCIETIQRNSTSVPETIAVTQKLIQILETICKESHACALLLCVHQQGYHRSVLPLLVRDLNAMQQMWEYWLATNSLTHFVLGADDQKPVLSLSQLHFRISVFFALCERYYNVSTSHDSVVNTVKQIVSKKLHLFVRAIVMTHDDTKAHFSSADTQLQEKGGASNVSWTMLTSLMEAAATCCRHIDFLVPFVQFLHQIKKEYALTDTEDATPERSVQFQLHALVTRSFRHMCQSTT